MDRRHSVSRRAAAITLFSAVLGGALAARVSELQARPTPPQFRFGGLPPLPLRAAKIVIVDSYASAPDAGVQGRYQAAPADIVRGWARDRIRLVGAGGTVTVRILDAHVAEKKLPVKKGLVGLFKDEQDRELDAYLRVEIMLDHAEGHGSVVAEAHAGRTLGERASLNEEEEQYYTLLRELANFFDSAMTAQVQAHLVGL